MTEKFKIWSRYRAPCIMVKETGSLFCFPNLTHKEVRNLIELLEMVNK